MYLNQISRAENVFAEHNHYLFNDHERTEIKRGSHCLALKIIKFLLRFIIGHHQADFAWFVSSLIFRFFFCKSNILAMTFIKLLPKLTFKYTFYGRLSHLGRLGYVEVFFNVVMRLEFLLPLRLQFQPIHFVSLLRYS